MTTEEMKEIVLKNIRYNFKTAVMYSKKFYEAPIGEGEAYQSMAHSYLDRCLEGNELFSRLFGYCEITDKVLIHKFVYREDLD